MGSVSSLGCRMSPQGPGRWSKKEAGAKSLGAVDAVPYHGPLGHLTAGWPVSPFLGKAYSLPWGLARVGLLVSENEGGNWKKPEGEREVAQARGMCGDKPRPPGWGAMKAGDLGAAWRG